MHIEELSMNAWPALQTLLYDGWVIRFANGYTKRANSINPIYKSQLDAAEKIANCERLYRQRNLDVVFKMTSAVHPKNLDEMLASREYRVDSPTSVQTMVLNGADSPLSADLDTALTDEWLADFCRMSGVNDERKSTLRQMLANIVPQKCFAAIRQGGETVACGLGVLQENTSGSMTSSRKHPFEIKGTADKSCATC
jgi:hypothetical protein